MRRKGTAVDLIIVPVLLIVGVFVFMLASQINTDVLNSFNNTITDFNSTAMEDADRALNAWNTLFIFLLFGGGIATVISAFMIDTHPAFFGFSVLLLGVVVMLAGIFTNVFATLTSASVFTTAQTAFATTISVFKELPVITAGLGVVVLIALYAKIRGAGQP